MIVAWLCYIYFWLSGCHFLVLQLSEISRKIFVEVMPGKKRIVIAGSSTAAAGDKPEKVRKVSSKRLEGTLASLQKESEAQRLEEQMSVIVLECRKSIGSRNQCFTICKK